MPDIDTSPEALRALAAEADYAMDLNALVKWAVKVRKLLRTLAAIAAEKEAATVKPDLTVGSAASDRSAWLAGYRACADTIQSYRAARYDWGPKATAQDGADLATQSIKDVVAWSLARAMAASVQTSEQSGNSRDIPDDQDALIRTLRASLAGAKQERDAARSEAKNEAAEFIFGVLEGALGNPAYNPCDGTETWDGDVAETVYRILNASGLRNEDTGELATARAEKMRVAFQKILRTASNGMRWEDKVVTIEELASGALAEQENSP